MKGGVIVIHLEEWTAEAVLDVMASVHETFKNDDNVKAYGAIRDKADRIMAVLDDSSHP